LGDVAQDEKNQRDISMARLIGKEKAFALFKEEMGLFEKRLKELNIYTPTFQKMSDMLYQQAAQHVKLLS